MLWRLERKYLHFAGKAPSLVKPRGVKAKQARHRCGGQASQAPPGPRLLPQHRVISQSPTWATCIGHVAKAELIHTSHTVAEGAEGEDTSLLGTAVRMGRQTRDSSPPLTHSGHSSHHRPEAGSLFCNMVCHTLSCSPYARPRLCELNGPPGCRSSSGS